MVAPSITSCMPVRPSRDLSKVGHSNINDRPLPLGDLGPSTVLTSGSSPSRRAGRTTDALSARASNRWGSTGSGRRAACPDDHRVVQSPAARAATLIRRLCRACHYDSRKKMIMTLLAGYKLMSLADVSGNVRHPGSDLVSLAVHGRWSSRLSGGPARAIPP
jgi:hypothetical protein